MKSEVASLRYYCHMNGDDCGLKGQHMKEAAHRRPCLSLGLLESLHSSDYPTLDPPLDGMKRTFLNTCPEVWFLKATQWGFFPKGSLALILPLLPCITTSLHHCITVSLHHYCALPFIPSKSYQAKTWTWGYEEVRCGKYTVYLKCLLLKIEI